MSVLSSLNSQFKCFRTYVDMDILEEWRLLGCYAVWLL
jgi:hypothetical protein